MSIWRQRFVETAPRTALAVFLALSACSDPNAEARTRNAIKGTQYAVDLDKCYETSKSLAEYGACAKKVDEKFGRKP